jgi:hypothetical protein
MGERVPLSKLRIHFYTHCKEHTDMYGEGEGEGE